MNKINQAKHPVLKFNRNDYYPYVQLPRAIELHLSGPVLPPRPENITAPTLPQKPDEPSIPEAPRVVMEKLEAALAIGAGVATLVSIIIAGAPGFVVTRGVITVVRLAKNAYDSYNYKNIELPKYEKELAEYLAKLKNWEEKCHSLKIEHQKKIQEAELEYRKQVEITTEFWKEGKTSFPEKIEPHSLTKDRNSERAKKGQNDNLFRSRLESKISLVKDIDIELFPEDNVLYCPDSEYRYTPDIAIQAKRDGKRLFIDIENDEPWYEENGRKYPIHEIDNRKHVKRDMFFVDQGWVVIRFSEQQVVTEADRCSDFILDVIQSIFQPSYLDIKFPKEHKRWSSGNALSVERPETRSHLNQVENLSNSKIENSKHSSSSRQQTDLKLRVTVTAAVCRTFRVLKVGHVDDLISTLVNRHLSGDWGKYGKYAEIAPMISTKSSLDWSIGELNVKALTTNKGEVFSEYLLTDILPPRKKSLWIKSICIRSYLGARNYVVISLPGESKEYDYDENQENYSHIDDFSFYQDYYREEFYEEWEEYMNDWEVSDWDERMKLVERDGDD